MMIKPQLSNKSNTKISLIKRKSNKVKKIYLFLPIIFFSTRFEIAAFKRHKMKFIFVVVVVHISYRIEPHPHKTELLIADPIVRVALDIRLANW